MKRRYLYVSIFFGFGMLLTVFAFYSYRSYKNRNSQPVKSQVNPVDTVKEIRTNTSMKYIVEVYEGVTELLPGKSLRCRQNLQVKQGKN